MQANQGIEDYRLAQGAIQGDSECRERLGERLLIVPRILRGLNRRRSQPLPSGDIDDIAQDVYVTVWKKLDQFRGEQGLEPWVYRMCQYRLLNRARSRMRDRSRHDAPSNEFLDQLPAQSTGDASDERLDRLAVQIQHLSPEVQRVILLHHVEGLTFQEIADQQQEHLSKLKSQYYRGLMRLRGLLEPDSPPPESPTPPRNR